MYPNLFVIGSAKSGTTSLHYYLDQHPEIHMSREKEPNFFAHPDNGGWPRHAVRDDAEYQALFESDKPIRGESSVSYTFWPYPDGVPERIHAVAPDARFIYVVRDPVARAISHYFHRIALGSETRTLEEVVADPHDHEERYLAASSYATQLEQYLSLFPMERFLVIDHAQLQSDRDGVMRECFEFLGVDPTFTSPNWELRMNERSDHVRFSPLGERIRHSGPYRKTIGWFHPELRRKLVQPFRRVLSAQVERPTQASEAAKAFFAERLAPEAARLREMTGKSFPSWSV